ncbi:MAG: CpsD/CapB family tyrosine-protein kinase [Methylococcaceae bacterium]|nr:CpsD/CapB family tyrosine-protein kinase [Methylococcaceae bacterium]
MFESNKSRSVELDRHFLRKQRIIAGYDSCPYIDAYKVLRTRVLQKMRERGWNTLAVTSPHVNAGKTLAAINLSISLAQEVNQTVLLVDASLRNPSIHRYLGLEPRYGLADHLLDRIAVEDILLHSNDIGQLTILPGNRPMIDSAEMLSSPQMASLVEALKMHSAARFVVYDLPHLQTADALAFVPQVDAVLLVIEAGATTQDELKHAFEHLQGVPVIGTLLNKSEQISRN